MTIIAVPDVAVLGGEADVDYTQTLSPSAAAAAAVALAAAPRTQLTPSAAAAGAEAVDVTPYSIYRATPDVAVLAGVAFRPALDYLQPRGREAIGVDQPPGGSLFPFSVEPSDDLDQLVADFYLSYEDAACRLQSPFRIAWLYGFGENPFGPLAGYPTPTHEFDLLILDAADNTVFDSTVAGTTISTRYWGDRLHIVEWQTATQVCRLVYHVAWGDNETPQVFDLHLAPTSAVLDERCFEPLPPRVTSLQYLVESLREDIRLVNGYNTTFVVSPLSNKDGERYGYKITVGAEPGSGAGQYDGCADSTPTLKALNGVKPNVDGNFTLDAADRLTQTGGCYRIERPSTVDEDASPPAAVFTEAALQLHNDCGPCCECDDFVNVYTALDQLWETYRALGVRAMALRDALGVGPDSIIERYKARTLSCSTCNLRMGLAVVPGNVVSASVEFCNNTPDLHPGGRMTITIAASVPPHVKIGLICGSTFISGDVNSSNCDFNNDALDGAYPNYYHDFAEIPSGSKASVAFQLIYPTSLYGSPVNVTITARLGSYVLTKTITTIPTLEVC